MRPSREQILAAVLEILDTVVKDWEFEAPIGANTRLFADLGFESLDLVVLGANVQEHFGQPFPFPQFFAEIGQRDVRDRDLTISEWVDFIEMHLQPAASRPAEAAGRV
jgi:acyl carrier protein